MFSENKAHFRFFYETQDVKVIFLRNTGSKFYETQDIIELFNKDFVKYNKDCVLFFSGFCKKSKTIVSIKRNCFNQKKLFQSKPTANAKPHIRFVRLREMAIAIAFVNDIIHL